jgi:hypothetical protein
MIGVLLCSALFLAIQRGHPDAGDILLARDDLDINWMNTQWNMCDYTTISVLGLSVSRGALWAVKRILERQDVNANACCRLQRVQVCTYKRDTKKNSRLYSRLLSPKHLTSEPLLLTAAREGCFKGLELLIADPRSNVDELGVHDKALLWWLCQHENEELVDQLLKVSSASINVQDQDGWALLHVAAMQRHQGLVRRLLQEPNIDPSIVNDDGFTALELSKLCGFNNITEHGSMTQVITFNSTSFINTETDEITTLACPGVDV